VGTNNLNNRSSGQTILETFWNDIHSAMNGDFVGRNATGVPTASQNLGTVALPWGSIRADSLILDGSAVDPSQLTAPQNRVVSGKMRSSSNQPAYIIPNGAAASFIIDGTPTNLVVDINGSSVSVTTDITKSSLTTAPSSQNTALVDDADAADQADTRIWGEFGHRKSITIDTVGTNITALIGKFASFKINNGSTDEYFLAYVESATKLSKIYRGYFYNSSIAPINRIVFSNNDTITLMSTAWVFIENDATTCDVTYNNPVWSFTAPNSPATGDYWYDLDNQTWKRYDGASFQIINRTFIGIAILDSSNCVAARCVDFYANYSEETSVDVELQSTEIVRATSTRQKINVAGTFIEFNNSLPTWNITTDLAASSEMYNATEQASRIYFLYVTDSGDTVISDIHPYDRGDLLGKYHPHNPWRCVGAAYNNASSDLSSTGSYANKNHHVRFYEIDGYGSTNTAVPKFTTLTRDTGAPSFNHNFSSSQATDGIRIEILESGTYSAVFHFSPGATGIAVGFTRNSEELTTDVRSLTDADEPEVLLNCKLSEVAQDNQDEITWSGFLNKGDVFNIHTSTNAFGTVDGFFDFMRDE
jgi:hypothetical protein